MSAEKESGAFRPKQLQQEAEKTLTGENYIESRLGTLEG